MRVNALKSILCKYDLQYTTSAGKDDSRTAVELQWASSQAMLLTENGRLTAWFRMIAVIASLASWVMNSIT